MEKLKSKKINDFIIALVFTFNICFFAPLEFYLVNIFDFWFSIDYILPTLIITFFIIFIITFLLCKIIKCNILIKVLFTLTVCLYIQGNYLNIGYGVLNGEDVNWKSMIAKGIVNTLIWIVLLLIPFFIKNLKKDDNFRIFSTLTLIFVLLIEIFSLGMIVLWNNVYSSNNNEIINSSFYLDANNIFELSKEENIILIISDTFEATYMNNILKEIPEYRYKLKDFTYFDNTTGTSLMTYSSMPTILTGETCQVGKNLKENIKYCFDNTNLYNVLKECGYDIELYTDMNLIPSESSGIIDNKIDTKVILDTSSKIKISKLLYECVLYKYLPHFLKSNFKVDTLEFDKVNSRNVNRFSIDDVEFNKKLLNSGIQTNTENKKFKLYHLNGIHTPYIVNSNIEYDTSKDYLELDEDERRNNQIIASLDILVNYIEELKKSNVYDNTTIIFMADHGWENRYNINFMIKPAKENSEFKISHAPLAMTEDLIPTIENIASNSKYFGKDIWDYSEGDYRKRDIYNYTFTRGDNTYNVLSKVTVSTEDIASDENKYYISNAEYVNSLERPKKMYNFGKRINLIKNKNMKYAIIEGFLQQDIRSISKGTNIGKNAVIRILRDETDQNVMANLLIKKVYYDNQKIKISINDKMLYEDVLNANDKNKLITFEIPKDEWNKNDILQLDLEFPDGKLGDPFALGEETLFMSILLESIVFIK